MYQIVTHRNAPIVESLEPKEITKDDKEYKDLLSDLRRHGSNEDGIT